MTGAVIPPDTEMVSFLCVTDRARARAFYGETLGLTLEADTPFALVYRCGGRSLRISEFAGLKPQPFTVCGWQVADVRAAARALAAKGVSFNRYDGMGQDEDGLWQPPGGDGYVTWFNDPDGNVLSLSGS